MLRAGQGSIPDRPNRPIIVRCGCDGLTRRVNFPSAATCRFDSLRSRIEECFSLSASPFHLIYTDDDGEDFSIRNEDDLTEAISYFFSGDDEPVSLHSGTGEAHRALSLPAMKITLRLEVIIEYDGPSLSETSSVSSFRRGELLEGTSEGSWESSGYTESYRGGLGRETIEEEEEQGWEDPRDASSTPSIHAGPSRIRSRQTSNFSSTISLSSSKDHRAPSPTVLRGPLTGPESDPAPSLLTHSELGTRWLREQSKLATTRSGPRIIDGRRYDSDDDGEGSDQESVGDLALVRDARGKYYYSYQTETSSSRSEVSLEAPEDEAVHRPSNRSSSSSSSTTSPPRTPHEIPRAPEPSGPPIIAPDCSACGIRLEYMRYVCETCGEGEMWKENAPGKAAFVPPRVASDRSDGSGSDSTSWALTTSTGTETVRSRSGSISTTASRGSVSGSAVASPTSLEFRYLRDHSPTDTTPPLIRKTLTPPRGYELCAGCIESHGIAHSKAASKAAKLEAKHFGKRTRGRGLRHTFRETIWGVEGWTDIGVSCPKFDLCRSCYQKVDEIHPVHAFLSLPDKPRPQAGPFRTARGSNVVAPQPIRHPGAFCHNCLQDIVGPRFHCAVCPSWDLCIQCEGVASSVNGNHTADHIMMKIPLPLESAEVELVSRRARDRWFQQDLNTVAAARPQSGGSSRSSSPTNETIYAGGQSQAPSNQNTSVVSLPIRDALDHGVRCRNCNEWIMGRRFQCANCPSDPVAYNLYKSRVGQIPANSVIDTRDPTAYLKHVLHREVREITLCDIHEDQIRGIWLRCAHCAAGFDICQEAEQIADHDATHVFVVFKARVDMAAFRQLADLAATHSRPLLRKQVYLS
ncbi:hypothetical protein P7C73_g1605, partial [Tremellales sp. Uapishka_1]